MITEVKRKTKKCAALKELVKERSQLNCFIREIEREEPLDDDTLKMILAFDPIY
ncbi:MAG: hypothetical protein ACERKD_02950 [Prolixibacteraceae bacterium]